MRVFTTSFYSGEDRWKNGAHPIQLALSRRGHSIVGPRSASVYIAIDFTFAGLAAAIRGGISRRNRVLVVQEPKVVLPQNHCTWLNAMFGRVIFLGRRANSYCLPWPQASLTGPNMAADFHLIREETNAVLVASDRLSLVSGENYSLRRQLATLPGVNTFGRDWKLLPNQKLKRLLWAIFSGVQSGSFTLKPLLNASLSPSAFFGSVPDKHKITSRYNIALVVENSSEYYSEKIFDAFASGNFPVYVGYKGLTNLGIPAKYFIQAEPTVSSVKEALAQASKIDFVVYRAELKNWLMSKPVAKTWSEASVWNEVLEVSLSNRPSDRFSENPKS